MPSRKHFDGTNFVAAFVVGGCVLGKCLGKLGKEAALSVVEDEVFLRRFRA
jgi:hypothetical protein